MTRDAVEEQVNRQLQGHLTYFFPGGGSAMGWTESERRRRRRIKNTQKNIHLANIVHTCLANLLQQRSRHRQNNKTKLVLAIPRLGQPMHTTGIIVFTDVVC